MVTIKDVAALAGVSTGTVSHVLSGARKVQPSIQQRVTEAVQALGYKPNHAARSLKSRRTRTIGMVVSDLTNPFFSEMMRGAEDAAQQRGYLLMTFNTDDKPERERRVFDVLEMRGMDGLLMVVALRRGPHPYIRNLVESGVPVVCLDRKPRDLKVDSVMVNNAAGVEMAVRHLVEDCGYRDIVYLGGQPSEMYLAGERLSGYRKAMKNAGLPERALSGDFRSETGYELTRNLLHSGQRPEAIFAGNFLMAAGAVAAMHDAGLSSPRDLGIACFDHVALLQGFKPHLTAVAQPGYQMGREGANLLIDRLEGCAASKKPIRRILPLELRLGDSTRRPGHTMVPL